MGCILADAPQHGQTFAGRSRPKRLMAVIRWCNDLQKPLFQPLLVQSVEFRRAKDRQKIAF